MTDKPRDWHSLLDRDPEYGNSVSRGISVGVASTQVLRANASRKKALFINDSDTIIYLSKGSIAYLNGGIRLNANGGSWEEAPDTLGYLYTGVYFAISSAAAKNLLVIEDL